jgi:hypothetical protein
LVTVTLSKSQMLMWMEDKITLQHFISTFKIINEQKFWSCNLKPEISTAILIAKQDSKEMCVWLFRVG